ncbi:MAG: FAD-dependent oxidoreductase [Planctomycetaceae bacterium]|nr:FAD-dependent oxidoreductase [Planctomycetaceae bacterium]
MSNEKKRILILGGGFAGVYTAMSLENGMFWGERDQYEISLVSLENYMVFQPLLPEVISGTIEMLHVITPIRRMAKRTRLHTREIVSIDMERKVVTLGPEFLPKTKELPFDHLVVALGSRLNYDMVPGMREHAIPFKYLGDALRLRTAIVQVLEEADNETNPDERRRLLTFVVGGGGFSGVECIAEIQDFLISAIASYPSIKAKDLRVVLLQSADRILPELGASLAKYAQNILEQRGIEIRLHTRLSAVTAEGAVLQSKNSTEPEFISARVVVATVPAAPHRLVEQLPVVKDKGGRVVVMPEMCVAGTPHLWAVGDCAAVPQPDGIMSPPTAQHALRQAHTCASNILATLRGTPLRRFSFTGLGKLASLGHRSAVAEVMGIKLHGFIAWVFWRAVYLSKFPGLDRKWRILTDWVLDIFLPRDITEVRIFHADSVSREHFHTGEAVFDQGDFGDKVYVVVKGEADVLRDGHSLATLKDGDIFGEMALISEQPRSAAVKAKTPLDVISISRDAFNKLVTHLPGVKTSMNEILQSRVTANQVVTPPPQSTDPES